jgi:hypothetical protein
VLATASRRSAHASAIVEPHRIGRGPASVRVLSLSAGESSTRAPPPRKRTPRRTLRILDEQDAALMDAVSAAFRKYRIDTTPADARRSLGSRAVPGHHLLTRSQDCGTASASGTAGTEVGISGMQNSPEPAPSRARFLLVTRRCSASAARTPGRVEPRSFPTADRAGLPGSTAPGS